MEAGYRLIFWGIVIMTFHVNIGRLEILPKFIGWALLVGGIIELKEKQSVRDYNKANVLAVIGFLYTIFSFISNPGGYPISNNYLTLGILLISVVEPLTGFFIIKGSAEYLYDRGNVDYAHDLMKSARKYVIFYLIISAIFIVTYIEGLSLAMTICIILALIMRIWFMVIIHGLKKYYSWKQ